MSDDFREYDWNSLYAILNERARVVLRGFPPEIRSDQDDLVQEVIIKFLSFVEETPERRIHSVEGLLSTMLKHKAIDRWRKLASLKEREEHNAWTQDRFSSRETDGFDNLFLESALNELTDDERELFSRFSIDKVKIVELAKESGIAYSAIAKRINRIKHKLKSILESN